MRNRILHVLSQRPGRTGSGVTLDAVVEQAGRAGWDQAAVFGIPAGESPPLVGNLDPTALFPVRFRGARPGGPPGDLDFPVPGMSDVMPYPSSVWSGLTAGQLDDYRRVWTAHLQDAIDRFRPHLIHTNHLWLVSALVRRAAPDLPVVATCHATGLRQRELCPHLAEEVAHGCRRIDRFCVLRDDHRWQLARTLAVGPDRITVTGAGYRDDLFHPGRTPADPDQVLYVGKFSAAKGLPWLLDAVEALAPARPRLRLHVAGGGAGPEAEALRRRMASLDPLVVMHGQLGQPDLADLMRRCGVCALPSFFEGVPLVLVEAAACGCRLLATALPGVLEQLAPCLGKRIHLVDLPRLIAVDEPDPAGLPGFTRDLERTLDEALNAAGGGSCDPPPDLSGFTWSAVFRRVERVWKDLLGTGA